MAYSYTEKKRIRKDFGRQPEVLEVPYLLTMQLDSYRQFLQLDVPPEKREEIGLHAAFKSVFPIISHSEHVILDYVSYRLGIPVFDVKECQSRGQTYAAPLRVLLRLVIYDREAPAGSKVIKNVKEQEVYMGEFPLMTDNGTFVINGTERVIVSQLHRSPGVFFDHDKGKTHSSGKLLFNARVIPYRGSWLDFEFDPKDAIFVRIDRRRKLPATVLLHALGYDDEQVLDIFFKKIEVMVLGDDEYEVDLVPERLRSEIATADIAVNGEVLVEAGQRISARHVRKMEQAGLQKLRVPEEFLYGKILSHNIVDESTGELVAKANAELNSDLLASIRTLGIKMFPIIYTNELDQGSYISNTLIIDSTHSQLEAQVEVYRMMRPGEPPTKDAAQNLFNNLFFNPDRYDLSAVGRMKFNRRMGHKEETGPGVLTHEDILDVLKTLIDIRNGNGIVDDIDHLGNRRIRSVDSRPRPFLMPHSIGGGNCPLLCCCMHWDTTMSKSSIYSLRKLRSWYLVMTNMKSISCRNACGARLRPQTSQSMARYWSKQANGLAHAMFARWSRPVCRSCGYLKSFCTGKFFLIIS